MPAASDEVTSTAISARLILASGSPRRRELIAGLGLVAEVRPTEVEEWEASDANPAALVAHNASLKADAAMARAPGEPILAADTTVALGDEVLNKPVDLAEARAMLRRMSGRSHVVYTAVSLRWSGRFAPIDFTETSVVTFKAFGEASIDAYFERVNPLDKAGAYGIQDGRELIIENWSGSLHNIMGLPTERLQTVFEQEGWWPVLEKRA